MLRASGIRTSSRRLSSGSLAPSKNHNWHGPYGCRRSYRGCRSSRRRRRSAATWPNWKVGRTTSLDDGFVAPGTEACDDMIGKLRKPPKVALQPQPAASGAFARGHRERGSGWQAGPPSEPVTGARTACSCCILAAERHPQCGRCPHYVMFPHLLLGSGLSATGPILVRSPATGLMRESHAASSRLLA